MVKRKLFEPARTASLDIVLAMAFRSRTVSFTGPTGVRRSVEVIGEASMKWRLWGSTS
jgi:hypothetical protein